MLKYKQKTLVPIYCEPPPHGVVNSQTSITHNSTSKKKYSSTNFTILIIGLFVILFLKMLFINFEATATSQLS
jgi:hypothetical protein